MYKLIVEKLTNAVVRFSIATVLFFYHHPLPAIFLLAGVIAFIIPLSMFAVACCPMLFLMVSGVDVAGGLFDNGAPVQLAFIAAVGFVMLLLESIGLMVYFWLFKAWWS